MKPIIAIVASLLLLAPVVSLKAQTDSVQNLYFTRKGEATVFRNPDYMPGKKAFYIYRNCFYDFVLKNKLQMMVKVIDIKNDSIYYTAYINQSAANNNRDKNDTLSMPPSSIRRIRLIGDRIMGLYSGYRLGKYNYSFETSDSAKRFMTSLDTSYAKDSSTSTVYEIVPYMTAQGLDAIYERSGTTYYYRGTPATEERKDTANAIPAKHIVKKIVWITPSNVSEVRGVNFSLQTMAWNDNQPLTIRGVNLGADALSFFLGSFGLIYLGAGNSLINLPDTIDRSAPQTSIYGVNISAGGFVGDYIKGFAVNGLISTSTRAHGFMITGTQSLFEEFKGVMISGLRNRAITGKGLQIGLLNICKHLKGVQIGLWNVNSKRKLPFINWDFRSTQKRST